MTADEVLERYASVIDEVVLTCMPVLEHYCERHGTMEDVTQEALLTAVRVAPVMDEGRGDESCRHFLGKAVRSRLYALAAAGPLIRISSAVLGRSGRKARRAEYQRALLLQDTVPLTEECLASVPPVEDRGLVGDDIMAALGRLSNMERDLVLVRFGPEESRLTLQTVGDSWGVTKERARQWVERARQRAKELLACRNLGIN